VVVEEEKAMDGVMLALVSVLGAVSAPYNPSHPLLLFVAVVLLGIV